MARIQDPGKWATNLVRAGSPQFYALEPGFDQIIVTPVNGSTGTIVPEPGALDASPAMTVNQQVRFGPVVGRTVVKVAADQGYLIVSSPWPVSFVTSQ